MLRYRANLKKLIIAVPCVLVLAEAPEANAVITFSGNLPSAGDVGLHPIFIPAPGDFSATTVGTPGTLADTMLFLFDENLMGVAANDDAEGTPRSTLSVTLAQAGNYYIGISKFGTYPFSDQGLIFDYAQQGVMGLGPGGGASLSTGGWYSVAPSGDAGTYTIAVTQSESAHQAPAPGAALLGLMGLGAVHFLRRRTPV